MVHLARNPPVIPEADAFAAAVRDLAPMQLAPGPGSARVARSRERPGRDDG
jgi:hypothetical protein